MHPPDDCEKLGRQTLPRPKITHAAPIDFAQSRLLPRARGRLAVSSKRRDGRSVIADLHQAGSLKALFPRTGSADLDLVFLNTAGGLTGGDVFDIALSAGPDSRMTVTTQAAERIYGAVGDVAARLSSRVEIGAGARLDWLPQETIFFDRGALRRRLDVMMAADARFLMVEPLVLGRQAMGEDVRAGLFADDLRLVRDGALVFADAVRLVGDLQAQMRGPATGAGARAMAAVLFVAPDAEAALPLVRDLLPATGGASLIRDGVLFVRLLAADGYALRQSLCPILTRLQGGPLPKTWML